MRIILWMVCTAYAMVCMFPACARSHFNINFTNFKAYYLSDSKHNRHLLCDQFLLPTASLLSCQERSVTLMRSCHSRPESNMHADRWWLKFGDNVKGTKGANLFFSAWYVCPRHILYPNQQCSRTLSTHSRKRKCAPVSASASRTSQVFSQTKWLIRGTVTSD